MSERTGENPPIRHITYADGAGITTGRSFGDHYINQDPKRFPLLAEQTMVTIYPEGNRMLTDPEFSAFRYEPHVEIKVFIGGKWEVRNRVFIGK